MVWQFTTYTFLTLAEQALTGEITSYQVEKRYLKKNHETLWCNLTATILRNQGGCLEFFPGEHVGIRAMQERVELVGGHFLVSSQPGVGTLLVAEVPATTSDEAKTDAALLSLLSDERSIEYEQ